MLLVRPAGFEPTTPWFVAKYSIQLSYGRCKEKNYISFFDNADDMTTENTTRTIESDFCLPFLKIIWQAVHGSAEHTQSVTFTGTGNLPSYFAVTDLAAASMGAAGLALASLIRAQRQTALQRDGAHATRTSEPTQIHFDGNDTPPPLTVEVDRRLASFWFSSTLRPDGWVPPGHAELASADYLAQDGWLRLHTNAAHHREAAVRVLGCEATHAAVADAVKNWPKEELVERVVAQGGCAATMLSPAQWQQHPQGRAVNDAPLIAWSSGTQAHHTHWDFEPARPLKGLKILDMTRVLAGPAATRMLAGLGAQVLRVDAPMWNESNAAEMTLGKHCTELDLRVASQRAHWLQLLSEADVLVHGYRSDALEMLGLDAHARQQIRPGLIDVSLDAYGFSGPWQHRRGFDSLVQMSMGIAQAGQLFSGADRPLPLPVQALDHATGYFLATAVLRSLEKRLKTGQGSIARASLARTGALLMTTLHAANIERPTLLPETLKDLSAQVESTHWGPARRMTWPLKVTGVEMNWPIGAGPLKRHPALWS